MLLPLRDGLRSGDVRLDGNGGLIIPPLTAEDIPAEAAALREELSSRLPFAPIASLGHRCRRAV